MSNAYFDPWERLTNENMVSVNIECESECTW